MKNTIICFTLILFSRFAFSQWQEEPSQWKSETIENFDGKYRLAQITSNSHNEKLNLIYSMTDNYSNKSRDPYNHISMKITLNYNIAKDSFYPNRLNFRFKDNPTIYSLSLDSFETEWNATSKTYVISPLLRFSIDDPDGTKGFIPYTPGADIFDAENFIPLLKTHQKVFCRISLANKFNDNLRKSIDMEFTLQNSTNAINYLFQEY